MILTRNNLEMLLNAISAVHSLKSFKSVNDFPDNVTIDMFPRAYGDEDGADTDIVYCVLALRDETHLDNVEIKFSVDVDKNTDDIAYIDTDSVDILINGEFYDCISINL